jgi:hypothetical protein
VGIFVILVVITRVGSGSETESDRGQERAREGERGRERAREGETGRERG